MFCRFLVFVKLFLALTLCAACGNNVSLLSMQPSAEETERGLNIVKFRKKAKEAKSFCEAQKLSTDMCLLIDYSIHSGKNRMVVWDFKADTIAHAALVSHGCGDQPWGKDRSKAAPVFSNVNNSHCSSLGKYKIGARGYSQWGIKVNYLMHGLEATNSNALKREIVFHSWEAIADEEVYPDGTPEGWGCPAVSNKFMTMVDSLLKAQQKPVLMWAFTN